MDVYKAGSKSPDIGSRAEPQKGTEMIGGFTSLTAIAPARGDSMITVPAD